MSVYGFSGQAICGSVGSYKNGNPRDAAVAHAAMSSDASFPVTKTPVVSSPTGGKFRADGGVGVTS